MKAENAIEVINLKKRFKIYFDKGSSMKEKVLFWNRNRYEDHWVLKGINFEVKKGEAIGLIGKNGCGKSTTLKMLTKIMYPTEGTIEMKGRISSLIELGAGFHPDMSGRENIFTNASIFGLNRTEIEQRLDDIIKFSELEEFIDSPVRTYSSGMYMRLAFAVAINVDADILLIDEILAVGDVSFQTKCFEKLKEIKRKGTTIVIVSHVMGQIEQICDRAIWIEEGLIKEEGKTRNIGQHYLASMEEKRLQKIEDEFKEHSISSKSINNINKSHNEVLSDEGSDNTKEQKKIEVENCIIPKSKVVSKKIIIDVLPDFCDAEATRMGNREVEIIDFHILNKQREDKVVFETGENIQILINYKSIRRQYVDFRLGISRDDGVHCYGISTLNELKKEVEVNLDGNVTLNIELNLLPAKYWIDIGIKTVDQVNLDVIHGIRYIEVKNLNTYESGISKLQHQWIL